MPRKLESLKDKKKEKTSIRDSFNAFKYIPRFSSEIWKTSRVMYSINTFARLLNAFAPVILLWVGKLIIDEIILQINTPEKDYSLLWKYVALELFVALISDLISRLITLTDSLLGDLYANKSSVTIIKKTNEIKFETNEH